MRKKEKNQGVGQATARRRMPAGAALPLAEGDGRPSLEAQFFLTGDGLARCPCNRSSTIPNFPLEIPLSLNVGDRFFTRIFTPLNSLKNTLRVYD